MERIRKDTVNGQGEFVTAKKVAELMHVSPKTVARWSNEGKLAHSRTLGGHRRYRLADLQALAGGLEVAATNGPAVQ